MPVSFSSPPRNLFLLGSSGADVVRNFFHEIDKSASQDDVYIPDEIRYDYNNDRYTIVGTAQNSNSKEFGWIERRDYDPDLTSNPSVPTSTNDWSVKVENTSTNIDTTLRAMESYGNNLIVVGKTGSVPWIAKYSNGGVIDWQTTTNSADVEYTGVCSDGTNYYACGNTPVTGTAQAFVEKFDSVGNPSWGKSAFMVGRDVVLEKISANTRGEVIAVGYIEDDSANKGYIIKIDTSTGKVLWDRTLERNISGSGNDGGNGNDDIAPADVRCTATYIDGNDQIYVVGSINGRSPVNNGVGEFLVKYSPEGNILWQRENNTDHYTNLDGAPNMIPFDVQSDTETEQTVVLSVQDQGSFALNNSDIFISKYSRDGSLVFKRKISKGSNNLGAASLDADPSFYYVLFRDQQIAPLAGTPNRYFFGKVSTSGNGLGNFQYDDGGSTPVDYTIVTNTYNKIGRLSDGSVRNDTSDFVTYPFTANKLVFDDYATPVSNKKRQMDGPDSFEYSGSPAIRPADFQELNLLGDNVSERTWIDSSGKGNNGLASLTEPFFGAGSVSFDGSGDSISVGSLLPTSTGTAFTVDMFWRSTSNTSQTCLWAQHNSGSGRTAYLINGTNAFLVSEGNVIGNFAYSNKVWYFTRVTYTAGGAIEVFVDGVSQGTGTQTVGVDNTNFVIGDRSGASESLNGYISNCRVVVGSALSGAEVPTTSLNAITGTELLTCQGNTIADASPNNFAITVNGNAASTDDGPTHNAAGYWEFVGTSTSAKYMDVDLPKDLIASNFSLEFWFRGEPNAAGSAAQFIAQQGRMSPGNGDFNAAWRIERNNSTSGSIEFGIQNGSSFGTNELISNNFPDNIWHHCVCVYKDGSRFIYKNGELDTSSNTFSGTATSPHDDMTVRIGARADSSLFGYRGDIGQFRIYPRAITAAQVYQNYNATKSQYINEAPDTAPKISDRAIVYGSNLLLNYDFGNRATYDRAENLIANNEIRYAADGGIWQDIGRSDLEYGFGDPFGGNTATKITRTSGDGLIRLPNYTMIGGGPWTFSAYAKIISGIGGAIRLDISDCSPAKTAQVISKDEWTRIEFTYQTSDVNTGASNDYLDIECGSGITEWLIAGIQIESGSSAGRPIRTYGSAITAPTTVKNLSSSSFSGTADGCTFNSDGYFEFDGTNDEMNIAYSSNMAFANSILSCEAWIYADTLGSKEFSIINKRGNNSTQNTNRPYTFGVASDGRVRWILNDASTLCDTATGLIQTGQWYHLAATHDGTNAKIYVNGIVNVSVASGTSSFADTGNVPTRIGYRYRNSDVNYSDGKIAELRVYNTGLSATEVSQNFNATRGRYGV